ncbi:pectinesterase family protein [Lentzea sp. BCCO 10_0856]|uniref:Pectinesterase family protein n=1 Tax=Lentzea miocenica TaxID=3095431 RepID=A0ABU4TFM7_9PSEU|nr:pectinesterase family protein [Lentzea sp. BCCO 10_0856]MDX8036687.1 pectinesterase family protein [Lentzea sp. BCCO 10_0856]
MRLFVSALILACAGTGVVGVPALAGHDPARQVLPAGDGWASSGPGTTGGAAAPAGHVHEVRSRAELVAALAAPAPRIIKVTGVIEANTGADGKPLRCADYATGGYTLAGYLAAYDPAVWGRDREPEGPLEDARAASARNQAAVIGFDVGADTTIIGARPGAGITGGSLRIHGVRNVIVRNLTFRDTSDCFPAWDPNDNSPGAPPGNWNSLYDSVSVQKSENVWVDHNTFTDEPNVDSSHPLYFGRPYEVHDGQLDITSAADLVTVSRNVFAEHGKTMLIGSSNSSTTDPGKLRVSVHHNVFRNVQERAPRVRFGQVHVYNNLYEGSQTYSWGVGVRSQIYAQNNFVRGIAPEKVVYNWGGTAITDTGNLVDGQPTSLVDAHNAANPTKQLGTDAGWTPTLNRGLEPAHRIKHLKAGAPAAGRHLVVGNGFATVQSAIDAAPAGGVITLRKGVYREVVKIPASKKGLTLRGATGRAQDVVIDFDNANGTKKPDGTTYGTSGSATATIAADDFTARDLTFRNSFDRAGHPEITNTQAVAVKATGDRMFFDRVHFEGHQDTLYADTPNVATRSRQYYRDCAITGDVDFLFGRATAVFERATITALNRGGDPNGYLTAASTQRANPYGFLIVDSQVRSDAPAGTYYLGRPWHPGGDTEAIAQVVIRNTKLPAAIKAAPWTDMSGFPWREARFAEYRNTGPGAGQGTDRPQLTDDQAKRFTKGTYLGGWNPA